MTEWKGAGGGRSSENMVGLRQGVDADDSGHIVIVPNRRVHK